MRAVVTLSLDSDVLETLESHAQQTGLALSGLISDALESFLTEDRDKGDANEDATRGISKRKNAGGDRADRTEARAIGQRAR